MLIPAFADYGLGRKEAADSRDRLFSVGPLLARLPRRRPRRRNWSTSWRGNQKSTSQCVGFMWRAFLSCTPRSLVDRVEAALPAPKEIYDGAQKLDEWEGEDYEGTSVRAGAKFLVEQHPYPDLKEFRWAFNLNDCLDWLAFHGPLGIGVPWYTLMFTPDSEGVIKRQGSNEGGHAILAKGYDEDKRRIKLQNSWKEDWGIGGDCFVGFDDFALLLAEDGEAATATKLWQPKAAAAIAGTIVMPGSVPPGP